MRAFPHVVALATLMLGAASSQSSAQSQFTWIALDQSPPGTPPTIVATLNSDLSHTELDVTIHGFWYETITQGMQVFRRISLERMAQDATLYRTVGRPELPAIVHAVGSLVSAQPQPEPPVVTVLDEVTISAADIYPVQTPIKDHEGDPPPPFQWDTAFYQQTSTAYPAVRGAARGKLGRWSGLDVVAAESYPFRAIPALHQLKVARHYIVTLAHSGTGSPQTVTITRRQGTQYQRVLQNWTVVQQFRPLDIVTYRGDYLIITWPSFVDAIQPLVDQKRARGYRVTVATTDETGESCFFIREYIADWWAIDPTRDHYVLLVGNDFRIPMCSDENGNESDRIYVCVDGTSADGFPDPLPEARIGRFPAQTSDEVEDMVYKTLFYEEGFEPTDTWLYNVILTAHQETDPGRYKLCQEVVADRVYPSPPTFVELYGGDGATNQNVADAIEAGASIVCYRGHGTATQWVGWSLDDGSFEFPLAINNSFKPVVVFSIACSNNYVPIFNSIGTEWVKTKFGRAAAHYGASVPSWTEANHVLDLYLFWTVYGDNVRILGEVTDAASIVMTEEWPLEGEYNAWIYLNLGDPELEIWTEPPPPFVATDYPAEVGLGPGTLTVRVRNDAPAAAVTAAGQDRGSAFQSAVLDTSPVPFATVSVHKPGEVAASYYTNSMGVAQIPIDPSTPGPLALTVYTELDPRGVVSDTIQVLGPIAAPLPSPGPALHLEAPRPSPFGTEGTTLAYALPSAGRVQLAVHDLRGAVVTVLADESQPAGAHRLVWDGRNARGTQVGAGIYFVKLEFLGESRVERAIKLR